MLMPADIASNVQRVLQKARKGKGTERPFLTAYQILNRLPKALRLQIITERKRPGKGAQVHFAAASLVSKAAAGLPGVEITYLDTRGLGFHVDGALVAAGYGVCGLYRLP
jgi:hypothetical protein